MIQGDARSGWTTDLRRRTWQSKICDEIRQRVEILITREESHIPAITPELAAELTRIQEANRAQVASKNSVSFQRFMNVSPAVISPPAPRAVRSAPPQPLE
jgi:hypothetical protein